MKNLTEAAGWLIARASEIAYSEGGIPTGVTIDYTVIDGETYERPSDKLEGIGHIVALVDRSGSGPTEADAFDVLASAVADQLVRKFKFAVDDLGATVASVGLVLQRQARVEYGPHDVTIKWRVGVYRDLVEPDDE